ncbi:MAG TPA: hypothetical protein VGF25_02760 [Thermoleophilaceae bacterium]
MSTPAIAVAFFDPARDVYGTARSGATLLFDGRRPTIHPQGPSLELDGGRVRAVLDDRLSLELEPVSDEADLDGVTARLCHVRGEVGGRGIDCLGTLSETHEPPSWEELELVRSVSALVDDRNAVLALARRPRGARGHGDERVSAWLLQDGKLLAVEEARISTVYDGSGRQRSAGLELWLPGEEFPHRGSGAALAGSSLELDELTVHAAVFRWRLDGRDGAGAYELMARAEPPAAA